MHVYKAYNAVMPTTAAMTKVATGTSLKTMLQLATPSTRQISILGWGYNLDSVPNATSTIELIEADQGATVTAHVAAGVQPQTPGIPASLLTLGTTATGYTSTAEQPGSAIAATRSFDTVVLDPTAGEAGTRYEYEWLPLAAPAVAVSKFVRLRVTMGQTTNMLCWIVWAE